MGYQWSQDFEDGQTRAACSKCGVPYRWPSELVKLDDGFFYCKRRCLEQTVRTRDRIIAQSRKRREMPPPKFVQPPQYAADYRDAESAVFERVTTTYASLTDPADIGWAANYLADILLQAERPTLWDTRARPILTALCNTLLTLQYGAPTGPSPGTTVERLRYGGFASGTDLTTYGTAVAGVALLKGYRVIADPLYLVAASRCAHFLRHMQCQDLDNNTQRSLWNGGPYHVGGFADSVTATSTIQWTSRYAISNAVAVWFLDQLADIQGGSTQYGAASSADFTASTVATLDTMIDEFLAFITVGAYDSAQSSQKTTGLSTTYPRAAYLAQSDSSANTGTWALSVAAGSPGQVLRGRDVALALFSLNQIGEATDLVNSVFDWLMTFTANPDNAAPEEDPSLLIGNLKGTYSPKMAIANELDVLSDAGDAMSQEHVGAAYDWNATALLAPIASVRLPANFKASKTQLSIMQPSAAGVEPCYLYTGITNTSGLSFQYALSTIGSTGSAARALSGGSGSSLTPPQDTLGLWFKSDAGVTKNASNQVSIWGDQASRHYDALAVNSLGVALPTSQWPVYTPNVFGTLPGLLCDGTSTNLNCVFPPGTTNTPFSDAQPLTVLALAKCTNVLGGVIWTNRMNNNDTEYGYRRYSGAEAIPISSAQDAHAYFTPLVDYTGVTMLMTWRFFGSTASPQCEFTVNGVTIAMTSSQFLTDATGNSGFSIGWINATFNGWWHGYIGEILVYSGTDPATLTAARNYLSARGGTTDAPPKLLAYPYRWAPQAYGDRFFNPGQTP